MLTNNTAEMTQADELFWQHIQNNIIQDNTDRIYADWTASGRLYRPIENRISEVAGSLMANTHTEDSFTGREMTQWVHQAHNVIKEHVNASEQDVLLTVGSGMTGALAKFIRLLGLWTHEDHRQVVLDSLEQRPLVYITHREHHSNQTMWLESLAEVRIIPGLEGDEIDIEWLKTDLANEADRAVKFASITAASNVTGIITPYRDIAKIMHENNGKCFVDFAASAPYVDIDMHPADGEWLDAIYFSPHKFLGGPGSEGVLVFNSALYQNQVPEQPGGGTVVWTNPWGEHRFVDDIEQRESGGTPGILQTIKTALAIQLKDEMGVARILEREQYLNEILFSKLQEMPFIRVLSENHKHRLSVFSIVFNNLDYRKVVQILSNDYQVEARGGCACAGTYGHHLLGIDYCTSHSITDQLDDQHQDGKPGWVRISLHPSMSAAHVEKLAMAIEAVSQLDNSYVPSKEVTKQDLWAPLT
jgi:selenocysteine lyase/cysteine desulfurase